MRLKARTLPLDKATEAISMFSAWLSPCPWQNTQIYRRPVLVVLVSVVLVSVALVNLLTSA